MLEPQSIQEYFRDLVRDALKNHRIETFDETEFYIVNLLYEYTRAEKFHGGSENPLFEEPLALILSKALESSLKERMPLLKRIGDFSLFVSGFFSESLSKKLVDINYYIAMGENAYSHLAYLTREQFDSSPFHDIFIELSEKFATFVEILTEVSERSSFQRVDDIMRLYEKWLKTKETRYSRQLLKRGIIPLSDLPKKSFQ